MSSIPLDLLPTYEFGPFRLNSDGALLIDNHYLHVPPKELQVLRTLLAAKGQLIEQNALIDQVWPGGDVACESLTRCVYSLRKILGEYKHFIATVYGKGYRFEGPVIQRAAGQGSRSMTAVTLSAVWREGLRQLQRYTPQSLRAACCAFRQALREQPDCSASWSGLAISLLGQAALGRRTDQVLLKEVEQAVGRSLAADPENSEAIVLLAFVLSAQGSFDGAQALFRAAASGDAGPLALYYQAWHQWCWGMSEQAEHTLDACLDDLPHSLPAWILYVRMMFVRSPQQALAALAKARQQTEMSHPVLVSLQAMVLAYTGHAQAGRALLTSVGLDRALPAEPGLLRCYVIARLDRAEARREFRRWQVEEDFPPLCPAQLCVLRVMEGDGAVLATWQEMRAKACAWLKPQLADPRLLGL